VKSKVDKFTETQLHTGHLATQHLKGVLSNQTQIKDRNEGAAVVQKYGEIYGNQARKYIEADEFDKNQAVIMVEERRKKAQDARDKKSVAKATREAAKAAKLASK